jgi:lipopolysaccharide heptosyltransferase I
VKILILKPSSLGDVVQALPVLRLLKLHRPESRVYWWIDSDLAPLLEDDPDLTGLFQFDRRRWSSPLYWDELVASIRDLREQKFDCVIDLQGLIRSGIFAWLANGGLTIGLDDRREGAPAFYDLIVPRASFHTHAVDWYLGVLPLLHIPVHWDFAWLPPRGAVAALLRKRWPVDATRWVVVLPGARWANKRWPAEYFAEVVRRLSADSPDARFVILGGNADRNLGATISTAAPGRCQDLTGRTTLPEAVEWIRMSALVITNDTGPMHVAAALAKPVVALFGPTEPRRTGPYGQIGSVIQRTDLPCVPCLKDSCAYHKPLECLRALSPATVHERAQKLLDASPARNSAGSLPMSEAKSP